MPAFPPGPPPESGVVMITLSTGLQLQAEWVNAEWWSHLNENPQAAPIDPSYVIAWQPLE